MAEHGATETERFHLPSEFNVSNLFGWRLKSVLYSSRYSQMRMSLGSIRTMTSAPRTAATSKAASFGPRYRVAMRSAVSDTPSSMKRAAPQTSIARSGGSDSATRIVALGVAPQVPDLDVLLFDRHIEAAISPLVADRREQDGPIRPQDCEHRHQGLVQQVPQVVDGEVLPRNEP